MHAHARACVGAEVRRRHHRIGGQGGRKKTRGEKRSSFAVGEKRFVAKRERAVTMSARPRLLECMDKWLGQRRGTDANATTPALTHTSHPHTLTHSLLRWKALPPALSLPLKFEEMWRPGSLPRRRSATPQVVAVVLMGANQAERATRNRAPNVDTFSSFFVVLWTVLVHWCMRPRSCGCSCACEWPPHPRVHARPSPPSTRWSSGSAVLLPCSRLVARKRHWAAPAPLQQQ